MKRPVFVVGAPRSGTTLMHHMLLSAGGFARYPIETHAFNFLDYGFGDLRRRKNRRRMLDAWLRSRHLRLPGMDTKNLEARVLVECRSGGDFLEILMDEAMAQQNANRWAEHTPDHLLYIPEIKRRFPSALIVHVIRDGRDVALSLEKKGWIRSKGRNASSALMAAAMYWYWAVSRGRLHGQRISPDYIEVRYEALVQEPEAVLAQLSSFLDHHLDHSRIREVAIGTIRKPFSSFADRPAEGNGEWIGRWREMLNGASVKRLDLMIGDLLDELGYPIGSSADSSHFDWVSARTSLRWQLAYLDSKLWIKKNIPALATLGAGAESDHRMSQLTRSEETAKTKG